MRIEQLDQNQLAEFAAYCRKHKSEVDESFLYDEDLVQLLLDHENPSYAAFDEDGRVLAIASLILDEYHRHGRKARFRIFHSELDEPETYSQLLESLKAHTENFDKLFVFCPIVNESLMKIYPMLGFELERYSFFLVRSEKEVKHYVVPDGYELREFKLGVDEQNWCEVRNTAFATLKGSETPQTPDMVAKMAAASNAISGGMLLLFHAGKPVGIIRGEADEYEGAPVMNIGPVAIMPEYQGKGLGRVLLRAMLELAANRNYEKTSLCVNADNEWAKKLYLEEGFQQVEAVACFELKLS